MPVNHARAKSLFLAASDLTDPAERAAYVERECDGDAELRGRVEALLRANDAAPFLPSPDAQARDGTSAHVPDRPGPTEDYGDPTARVGAILAGKYKLIEEIGEGGMGSVYMAQQTEPVKRAVAVKVIKAGMDSKAVLTRFEAERQALAMMDHPNIAKVLDAGTTGGEPGGVSPGRPFFVMELVKGLPITKFCDERKLTPRQRLELFVPVCQAIQHAHQKGVIHRDIKPSNVLVAMYDDRPVPKVIDFGVAKAAGQTLTDKTLMTGFGAVVGTPEYMSPEQANLNNLDIDSRSDVYSLGVLLYELLTGTTPVDRKSLGKAAFLEILRIVREVEAPRPSAKLSTIDTLPSVAANRSTEPAKLSRLMKGELDWVVLKALEKDRTRRYETANGLARDVQRYLADEAVEARPPSTSYRLGKFLRRNRGPVIATGLVLLALIAGIAGTTWGMVRASRRAQGERQAKQDALAERDAKDKALDAETKARAAEKQARDQALSALRAMTDDIVENQMARGAILSDENKDFLRKIIKHFEGFAAITADDGESRAIRAEGYQRVGKMRIRLGELKEAETALADAAAIYKRLADEFPSQPEFRHGLAGSRLNLGILLQVTGRLREAEAAFDEAVAIEKRLVAESQNRPEFRQLLAASLNNQGGLFANFGRMKEAEATWREALEIYKLLVVEFPRPAGFRQDLARMHHNLGVVLIEMSRLREAATSYSEALAIRKTLADEFPARPDLRNDVASSHIAMGTLLYGRMGQVKEAETAFGEGLAILKRLVEDFPGRPDFRQQLAGGHNNFGGLLSDTGRLKEAEAAYADALAIRKQLAADFPHHAEARIAVAGTLVNLAVLCNRRGDYAAAEARLEEGRPHLEAILRANPQHPVCRRCYVHNLFASVGAKAGLLDQASAVRVAETMRDLGWNPPGDTYDAACALSQCIPIVEKHDKLNATQRQAAAKFYGDQALAMLRDAVAKGHKDAAHMKKDIDLSPLRGREDFKKLLAELEAKSVPNKEAAPKPPEQK